MILRDLSTKFSFDEIKGRIIELYPDQEINIDLYQKVFEELKNLEIKKSAKEMYIGIEEIFDENGLWFDVTGFIEGEDFRYSLQFQPWEQWLGFQIDQETIDALLEKDILIHCLWEMTYSGFTQEDIEKARMEIDNNRENEEFELITINDKLKIQIPKSLNQDEKDKTIAFFTDLIKDDNQAKAFFARIKQNQDIE